MKMNKPEIRFSGFSGEWGNLLFRENFDNIPNNTLSRADLNIRTGLVKNIHYGDILIKFGELLDVKKEVIPFITDDTISTKLRSNKLQNGDVIIADAAEDETVGKCTELINIKDEIVISGLHTIAVRPKVQFAPKYLGYYMNSSTYHNQLLRLMQGTKVLSISKSAIKDTLIWSPSDKLEQTQIGNFFQNLDQLISLHQKKYDKLVILKKAMLEKMFPKPGAKVPEIRFKGFEGDWGEILFSDFYKMGSGFAFKFQDYVDQGIPILNGESIQHGRIENKNLKFLPFNFVFEYSDFLLRTGDIVVGLNRPVTNGNLKIAKVPAYLNNSLLYQRAGKIVFVKDIDSNFSYVLLEKEILKHTLKEAVGSDQPFISNTKLNNWKMLKPIDKTEAVLIGNYFQNLDNLISLNQKQLEKLKNIKKACLEKMFV
jgi:type I restriction enzyme S subunit